MKGAESQYFFAKRAVSVFLPLCMLVLSAAVSGSVPSPSVLVPGRGGGPGECGRGRGVSPVRGAAGGGALRRPLSARLGWVGLGWAPAPSALPLLFPRAGCNFASEPSPGGSRRRGRWIGGALPAEQGREQGRAGPPRRPRSQLLLFPATA